MWNTLMKHQDNSGQLLYAYFPGLASVGSYFIGTLRPSFLYFSKSNLSSLTFSGNFS
jgi:hypothetical protein